MTAIAPGSKMRREIRIQGVGKPVQVLITSNGISFFIKGSRKHTFLPWPVAVEASVTPEDVPSYLMGKPLDLLKYQSART